MASSSSPPSSSSSSRQAGLDTAFQETVKALSSKDDGSMALILHGSGDVVPGEVNPETVHLLSSLTVQYISRLVDAALDSYTMFLNDPETIIVPPPSFAPRGAGRNQRTPAIPAPFERPNQPPKVVFQPRSTSVGASAASNANKEEEFPKRKPPKRHLREEYWDEGLPQPKIRSKVAKLPISTDAASTTSSRRAASIAATMGNDDEDDDKIVDALVPVDEWVGAIGVDLYERSVRKAHMQQAPAIATSHFVFPICHDVYAYGRVRDVQAAKRKLIPILQDPTIHQVIREEGKRRHRKAKAAANDAKGNKQKSSMLADDPEDEDEDDDDDDDDDDEFESSNIAKNLPMWPDMEFLLPIHRSALDK